jgi:uncharacterized protein YndB with AHSA1/START domain
MMSQTRDQTAVRLQRVIPAPPDKVYRAWLEPELLRRWLNPGDIITTRAEVDERVGGQYRIWQAGPDGASGGFEAEFLELVPNKRLVFKWAIVGPDRLAGPSYDSILTVTFEEAPGGATALTLLHERLDSLYAAMPDVAAQFGPGWDNVLGKLAAMLGKEK